MKGTLKIYFPTEVSPTGPRVTPHTFDSNQRWLKLFICDLIEEMEKIEIIGKNRNLGLVVRQR